MENDLEKEIAKIRKEIENRNALFIKENTDIKVGDKVEFIIKGDSYIGEEDEWECRDVTRLFIDNGKIKASIWGLSKDYLVSDLKLFDENDYKLRHYLWERELKPGDEFQLIVDKPKSSKGYLYHIYSVYSSTDRNIEYQYFNDYDKPQTLYEGEFHVTTKV